VVLAGQYDPIFVSLIQDCILESGLLGRDSEFGHQLKSAIAQTGTLSETKTETERRQDVSKKSSKSSSTNNADNWSEAIKPEERKRIQDRIGMSPGISSLHRRPEK